MNSTLTPSPRARELLRGAYDTHIHVASDVVPRIIDDVSLARRFQELGRAGFQLKSHYNATAERASVVNAAVPGFYCLGAIVLNQAVGGLDPLAVEVAAPGTIGEPIVVGQASLQRERRETDKRAGPQAGALSYDLDGLRARVETT